MEPNAWGDAPAAKATTRKDRYRQRRHGARGATMRTGSTNETDAKKRRRARSGHSKGASARPSAKADKDSTKKERGMEWVSDSDWASNRGTYTRQVSDPGKGRTLERAQNSQRLAASVRNTSKLAGSYRARKEASDRGSKSIRKDIGLSTNDNLRSWASAMKVDM